MVFSMFSFSNHHKLDRFDMFFDPGAFTAPGWNSSGYQDDRPWGIEKLGPARAQKLARDSFALWLSCCFWLFS